MDEREDLLLPRQKNPLVLVPQLRQSRELSRYLIAGHAAAERVPERGRCSHTETAAPNRPFARPNVPHHPRAPFLRASAWMRRLGGGFNDIRQCPNLRLNS